MRQWIDLFENQTVKKEFFLHVTKFENYRSIKTKGLLPNHNGGNYDSERWASLNGVYASRYVAQIHDYLRHHFIRNYLLIVIEVDMSIALPDEDLIDIIFDYTLEHQLKSEGLSVNGPEMDEIYPGDEGQFEHYVGILAKRFHDLAAGKFHIEINEQLLHDAADIWLSMKLGLDGGEGEMMWGEIKEKLVKLYPKMVHPELGHQHSIRIPSKVGFEGQTRIVAMVHEQGTGQSEVLYDNIPPESRDYVEDLISDVVFG